MNNKWIRRVLALVMALMLAVPAFALAETLQPKPVVQPYGTFNMNVGNKATIVLNGRTITSAKSSKSKVATIDKATGLITALSEGKTKITVKYNDRTRNVFTVQVFDPNKPSSVYFSEGASINMYAGQSRKLTPKLSPASAATAYTWKSSKKKIATVQDGVITALKPGTTKITVTTSNKLKAVITVNVLGNKVDNINAAPSSSLISTYTNKRAWNVVLKSVEILDNGKVAVEFYVINGIGTSLRIENLYVDLWVNNTQLVRGTIKKIGYKSTRGSCKVLKVTFPKTALVNRVSLPTLTSRYFHFNGFGLQGLTRR